jgi:quercetin dioxygenase-like cupin family protein
VVRFIHGRRQTGATPKLARGSATSFALRLESAAKRNQEVTMAIELGIKRRTLLYAFGVVSFRSMLPAQTVMRGKVAVSKPGETRFAFSSAQQAALSPCKLTEEDTAGTLSALELNIVAQSGPALHVHHREDEWYYVLAGDFLFRVGGETHNLSAGSSIWLPRDIPHVWMNTSDRDAKLLLICQPGGFEKFFDEMGRAMDKVPANSDAANQQMKEIMAKYGMELLGPPLSKSWRQKY